MFALAVALGCDLFDSAAYAIYARRARYMTEYGTSKLDNLEFFPCSCPACIKNDPKEVKTMPDFERQSILAEHNLHVSFSELKRIKQAIVEGRLWEHLELRAHGHPSLLQALKKLERYSVYLEKHGPVTKRSGLFFFSSLGLARPEVLRHQIRLLERYSPPIEAKILVLLPQTRTKPFHRSKEYREALEEIRRGMGDKADGLHVCIYAAPFGIVPIELDEVYPLSQYEIAGSFDTETLTYVARQVTNYIEITGFERIILLQDAATWKGEILAACRRACSKKRIPLMVLRSKENGEKSVLKDLATALERSLT